VKLNKIFYALLAASIITVALFATYFGYFSNQGNDTNSSEIITEQSQPFIQAQTETKSHTINQLLQKSPKIAPNDLASETPSDIGENDIETMEEALNEFYSAEDEQDREAALMTLGEYPDPKAKEAILYALNDPADIVREQAVSQISNWEDEKEQQQMLLMALNNDKHEIVVLALESIAELDDPALIQKVKELSSNKNEDISEAAKAALETSGSY
jgi:hypothetical protein